MAYYEEGDLAKFGDIGEEAPELAKAFFTYYGKVFEEGELIAKAEPVDDFSDIDDTEVAPDLRERAKRRKRQRTSSDRADGVESEVRGVGRHEDPVLDDDRAEANRGKGG